mmetsp:Transcript_37074/g.63052  ORF Transcript_37074/g.63052 Transcript_37074/m.63052 type:complete len:386 (+) Transcript_37074:302-1459(+)
MPDVIEARTSSDDIGVDEFNPDEIELEWVDSKHEQPHTIAKSNTNEFITGGGFCGGLTYHMESSGSKPRGDKYNDAPPTPQTPSTITEPTWAVPTPKGGMFGQGGGGEVKKGSRNAFEAQTQTNRHVPNQQVSNQWPFTGEAPPKKNNSGKNSLDMPQLTDKNNIAKVVSKPKISAHPSAKPNKNKVSSRTQPNSNVDLQKQHSTSTPEPSQKNFAKKRASTPEIMMAVSDAFSDVDISLEVSRPSNEQQPLKRNEDDMRLRPVATLEEEVQSPLETISEAFSDVDVGLERQQKTVSQRRKELEYLSKNWNQSKSQDIGSGSSNFVTAQNENSANQPRKSAISTHWSNEPKKPATKKKLGEPTLRLKGNKSLAKKFASLVKAYDD